MPTQSKQRKGLVSDSTRSFIKEGLKQENYSLGDFLHGYFYARWPYLYIGVSKGDHPLADKILPVIQFFTRLFNGRQPKNTNGTSTPVKKTHSMHQASGTSADGYHGKALPLETARKLVMINEPIEVKDLEQVIPYPKARAIILQNPDHIAVLDCPCRKHKTNPCKPMDVCIIVGEPFASFIIEHQEDNARWLTPEEAIDILEAENRRGHVQHAFFKDAMLGRFYAICNCCECCCGAINAHKNGTPMLTSSGYLAEINQDLCIGCLECHPYCQFGALYLNTTESTSVDSEICMGCGVCVDKCSEGAIALELAPSKGIPLEIEKLFAESAAQAIAENSHH
jgi:Pyruvate/2-oxoacid:ferredoxin oxidoreductase delta subunit